MPHPVKEGGYPSQGVPLLPSKKCGDAMGCKALPLDLKSLTAGIGIALTLNGAKGRHCPI